MPQLALLIGGLLTVLGIGGYVVGMAGDYASWTALIPAFAGVPILICGLIALRDETARKHAMHAAVLIALVGALAALMPLFRRVLNPDVETGWATKISVFGLLALCIWFVVAGINSFIQARRARQRGFEVQPRGADRT